MRCSFLDRLFAEDAGLPLNVAKDRGTQSGAGSKRPVRFPGLCLVRDIHWGAGGVRSAVHGEQYEPTYGPCQPIDGLNL